MESKQKLFYLPEAHTDFIYAVICEELGFIRRDGSDHALFAMYAWRGLRAAFNAPDGFGRMLALGVTAMVLFQSLINFAVVLGMMPTKGIPLPFVSYGGSSLLVMLLATGVLLNISQQAAPNAGCGIEPMKLLIAGGGTGGHVFPALAIAQEWMSRGTEREVVLVGTQRGIEMKLVPQAGLPLETLRVAGLKGKGGTTLVKNLAMLGSGLADAFGVIRNA